MKNQSKVKTIVIGTLLLVLSLTIIYLGFSTTRNLATSDTLATTIPKCIGITPDLDGICYARTNCQDNVTFSQITTPNLIDYCCTGISCANNGKLGCGGVTCTNKAVSDYIKDCAVSPAELSVSVCKDAQGTGFKDEFQACSINTYGSSDCKSGLSCCLCNNGYACGGKTKTCTDVCSAQGGTLTTTPPTGTGTSTTSCTSIKPKQAKLVSPANKSNLTETKVILTWSNNGGFGKECKDNGIPDRYILRYAVVDLNKACSSANASKYKRIQLVEKVKGQNTYSIEVSKLQPSKKYCWFIRKRNGETFTDSEIRHFSTPASSVQLPADSETVKLLEGGSTLQVGVEE